MEMKTKYLVAALAAVVMAGGSAAALAHHSFSAIFDDKQELEVDGVLSKVDWVNPHVYYYVVARNATGVETTWAFESFPPAFLRSLALSRQTLVDNIGKSVKVSYNPAQRKDQALGYARVLDFDGGPKIIFTAKPPGE
jgi:hypothetical protein